MKALSTIIAFIAILSYSEGIAQNNAVTIGNTDGDEVIVHVYKNHDDPFPFIEFSVTVDESTGQEIVEVTEVEGRTTTGGFMIISGVRPATHSDIGVTRSDRYQISFSRVTNYKVYEKAVMDYLRRLPVPEEEAPEIVIDEPREADVKPYEDISVDAEPIEIEPEIDLEMDELEELELEEEILANDVDQPAPVPGSLTLDSNSVVVHVHRNLDDIAPFKEFILQRDVTQPGQPISIKEVKGIQGSNKFMIMTGFDENEDGIEQSLDYDISAYNIEAYSDYEEKVLDFMLKLTDEQFSGEQETIDADWEETIAAIETEEEVADVPVAPVVMPQKGRKKKPSGPSPRELAKQAKKLEQAKYKAPKYKSKYGKFRSKKMSSRMSKASRKKVSCPTIRSRR